MPVKGISKVSVSRNGVGSFIIPCNKIKLQYCNWGGSSQGMRQFLQYRLSKFLNQYKMIEFEIVKKSGHPVTKGYYNNSQDKSICVKNLNIDEIENKLNLLINSSGNKLTMDKQPVKSLNESVRGIWSPFHVNPINRHKI